MRSSSRENRKGALLCMTTHGRSGLGEVFLGSVAEAVVRRSPAPIVLIGPHVESQWRLDDAPVTVVGYDGSAPARDAALGAGRLTAELGGTIRLIEVVRPSDIVTTPRFPAGDVDGLERLVGDLKERGVPAAFDVRDGFDPADLLVAQAQRLNGALVAVASHGRAGMKRLALGSVTMRIVRHAPCPVFVTGPCHPEE